MASAAVEYDAQGKPLPASSGATEYDASGKPITASTSAPQGNPGFFGPIQDAYDDAVARPPQADLDAVGPLGRGLANVGRHVMQAASPIIHPVKTAMALKDANSQPFGIAGAMAKSIGDDYKAHGLVEGTEDLAGDVLGGYLGGKAMEAPANVGAPMERIGYGAINDALGARGPKPFQYGHNPARGALDEGVVPAMTKQASSERVGPAMDRVGGDIATRIGSSQNTIPTRFLKDSIETPIAEKRAVMQGPGGNGATGPLDTMQQSMTTQAPKANTPIYGPGANLGPGNIMPSDVWRTIHNIDENTRFNPDPEVEGMNEVRRSVRGGLSGNLKDAVPEVAQPMQTYGDLAGARDAIDRTIHSGQSLSKIMDLIKYPAETYGGAGLVRGGQALQKLNPRFLQTLGTAPGVAAPLLRQGEK